MLKRFNQLKQLVSYFGAGMKRPVLQGSVIPRGFLVVGGVAGVLAGGFYLGDCRSAVHEYVFCPLIRRVTDAEEGHRLGIELMKYGLVPKLRDAESGGDNRELEVEVFGTKLNTPIGLAAGLDKDGDAIDALFDFGFSYVEVGSITPERQPGNPKPRFFRLPKDEAVINRYGFNSSGHFNVIAKLKMRLANYYKGLGSSSSPSLSSTLEVDNTGSNSFRSGKLLGINLGKNKFGDEITDYSKGVRRLGPYADVLIINVSSPNTPGLRDLQNELRLTNLLQTVVQERNAAGANLMGKVPPVLVKVAPDLTEPEIESIATSAKTAKVDGIIISNTTIQRPSSLVTTNKDLTSQTGGLSGKPLKHLSLQALRTLAKHTKGSDLVLVGCGGISSGKDVLEFGKAGATFVQLYTAFAYKGPGLPAKITDELKQELAREAKTWKDIVGEDVS